MDTIDDESVIVYHTIDGTEALAHKSLARNASSPVTTTGQLIRTANGQTVVFTSVASPNHSVKHGTVSQAIAVPQAGGGVSIVQLQIPNQSNVVQSVIQPNQQSVIQATGGAATVQTVQLPKGNVILLNKVGQGSVIHSTDTDSGIHHGVQIISKTEDGETITPVIFEDESRKRREILARRPSYRKILNDLSSTEAAGAVTTIPAEIKTEDDSDRSEGTATITVQGTQSYLKVLPASAIQLGSQDGTLQGIQTLTMTNAGGGQTNAIVQYATQGQDGQFYVPVTVSAADLQAYQIRTPSQTGITQGVVMTSGSLPSQQQVVEEASKKRELRLLKNREAAKECRRKKKEYIKCLENRVAVLENQNKALIEELKSLKELYCQKSE